MKRIAAVVATATVALLAAACSGSGATATGVAALPSPSAASTAQASPTLMPGASGQIAQALAYAQCMRAHGVPDWPDPNSSGVFDKSLVSNAVGQSLGTPQYQRYLHAASACQDLLPTNMRGPTQAQVQQAWVDDRNFAQCMRSLGVTNAPDPVADDEGRPYFNLSGTGIDPNSPQIKAKAQECQSQLHLASLPRASGGGGP